jgi:hypothetical protein
MRTAPERGLSLHQRIYRTLLLAYPRAFRHVYGADMVQVFGEHLRDERTRLGRAAGVRVWLHTLLDLIRSAPVQRMETEMSREAALALLFVLAVAIFIGVGMRGVGVPWSLASGGVLVLAAGALYFSGALRTERSVNNRPAGQLGWRQWWLAPAAIGGLVEIAFGVFMFVDDPKIENLAAMGILGAAGSMVLTGIWCRGRSQSRGDWMIAVGMVPAGVLFWTIIAPIVVGTTIVMAIVDSFRRPAPGAQRRVTGHRPGWGVDLRDPRDESLA